MTNSTTSSTILLMNTLASLLPANVARANFYRILDEVTTHLRQFTITHRGKQQAVVMSAEEFASWQETLEIISDKKLFRFYCFGITCTFGLFIVDISPTCQIHFG